MNLAYNDCWRRTSLSFIKILFHLRASHIVHYSTVNMCNNCPFYNTSVKFGTLIQPTGKYVMALESSLISAAYRVFLIYMLLLSKIFVLPIFKVLKCEI